MEIRPILSALMRNKIGATLIALQIALTLAIVCNAVFIIHDRVTSMDRPTGMDVDNIFAIDMAAYSNDYNAASATQANLTLLRGLPGVVDAAYTQSIPLSGGGWGDSAMLVQDDKAPTHPMGVYHMDEHGLNTLGVHLSEGRNFTHDEVQHSDFDTYKDPPIAIVSRHYADVLFPNQDPLGKVFYINAKNAVSIVGVVDEMQGTWPHWEHIEDQILFPVEFDDKFTRYLVRTLPGQRAQVMQEAEQRLNDAHTGNFVRKVQSLAQYRAEYYEDDHAMTVVLSVVTTLILAITALGIVGLASFSVRQRTKQIGTRRALGARRADILRYFMTENWLITSVGVLLGSVLAVGLNLWLVHLYDLPLLAWYYIPLGVLCLWVLGLLAVLGPALKAAAIPPAIATRSV